MKKAGLTGPGKMVDTPVPISWAMRETLAKLSRTESVAINGRLRNDGTCDYHETQPIGVRRCCRFDETRVVMPPIESGQPLRLRNCSQNTISFRFTGNKHDSRFPIGLLSRLMRWDELKFRMDVCRLTDPAVFKTQTHLSTLVFDFLSTMNTPENAPENPSVDNSVNNSVKNEFERVGDEPSQTLVQEFLQFIVENKKWWLIPILLSFGLIGLLVALSSTGAAPFIYTLF